MRRWIVVVSLLWWSPALAVPEYPQLIAVSGSPVYYDPGGDSNYFFYDGMYWIYRDDAWFTGAWFDGPWRAVSPLTVPVYILRIPVRFYRHPPAAFQDWNADEPPRWGDRWGNEWALLRRGWERWERTSAPRPAPLPVYQKDYAGSRYPGPELQATLREENYPYESQDILR